jgi:hypothetical protein
VKSVVEGDLKEKEEVEEEKERTAGREKARWEVRGEEVWREARRRPVDKGGCECVDGEEVKREERRTERTLQRRLDLRAEGRLLGDLDDNDGGDVDVLEKRGRPWRGRREGVARAFLLLESGGLLV